MSRHSYNQPRTPIDTFEVPGLVPDDEVAFMESAQHQPTGEAPAPLNFEIPALVPDEEPVAQRELESTNPGVLGFSIPKPREAPAAREASTQYAYRSQRREEIDHFMDLADAAAQEREQRTQQNVQYGLARRAVGGVVHQPPRPPV